MVLADSTVFIIVFALAFTITLTLVPLLDFLGKRWGIVSRYGGRHQTEGDLRRVSKLGGVAIFGGFTIAILAAQLLPVPRLDPYETIRLAGLLLGGISTTCS